MSTLYQEPIRAHFNDDGIQTPCLFAGLTSKDEAIIVEPDGTFSVVALDWVTIDWRYEEKGDRWHMLEDLISPPVDDDD